MPFTSASYTLTSLSDAPSYQLQLSMTGSPQGVLDISLYKNGALHTASVHVQARSWDGSTWAPSGAGGTMGGVATTGGVVSAMTTASVRPAASVTSRRNVIAPAFASTVTRPGSAG